MLKQDGQSDTSELRLEKKSNRRFRFLPGDAMIIGMIVVFCIVFWAGFFIYQKTTDKKVRYVRITQDGNVTMEIPMDKFTEPTEFYLPGKYGDVVIYISSEEVYIKESECTDKICVKTGALKKIGDGAVCLPCRVVVQIVGGKGDSGNVSGSSDFGEVDAVAK